MVASVLRNDPGVLLTLLPFLGGFIKTLPVRYWPCFLRGGACGVEYEHSAERTTFRHVRVHVRGGEGW